MSGVQKEKPQSDCIPQAAISALQSSNQKGSQIQLPFIEIIKAKANKEIIKIQSSDEDEPQASKLAPTKPIQKSKKTKQPSLKCAFCKASGKRAAMKICTGCKNAFHINCIQQQFERSKRYTCEKCRYDKQNYKKENCRKTANEPRQQFLDLEKLQQRKSDKRKAESDKRLKLFKEKYSFYCFDNKIRYPIEDKLLYIYELEVNETNKIQPQNHPIIPEKLLGDMLQIANFFSTFENELTNRNLIETTDHRLITLYTALSLQGVDTYYATFYPCLIRLYLSDIFEKNKTENVKILNENSFFGLMVILQENDEISDELLLKSNEQIIRNLATIPSFKKSFDQFCYPSQLCLETKVYVLTSLITGLSEVDSFKELCAEKSEVIQRLTKERGTLVTDLKNYEADNLNNKEKIKLLHRQQGTNELANKTEDDKKKKNIAKLETQNMKAQQNIKTKKEKIAEITKSLPFITSQVYYLGTDRNCSEYYFYKREPNRIYVKYRAYTLHCNNNYKLYESKHTIAEVAKTLNVRGMHEKSLYDNIQWMLKQQIIYDYSESDFVTHIGKINIEITVKKIVALLVQCEKILSEHLLFRDMEWALVGYRQNMIANLHLINDFDELKENMRHLHESFLYADTIRSDGRKKMEFYDDSDCERNEEQFNKKKNLIRIWGLNSEKTKKYWNQYLENCIDLKGLWIAAYILHSSINKYVKKKTEVIIERQKKEEKAHKIKERQRQKEIQRNNAEQRQRSRQHKLNSKKNQNQYEQSGNSSTEKLPQWRRPNLRQRKNRFKKIEQSAKEDRYSGNYEEQSQNQDICQICGEYGDMLCCDTCPKVYHIQCLKIVEIPEGEWSCFKCLEKLSNQRQTRSRLRQRK